jgi:hypothetical protein
MDAHQKKQKNHLTSSPNYDILCEPSKNQTIIPLMGAPVEFTRATLMWTPSDDHHSLDPDFHTAWKVFSFRTELCVFLMFREREPEAEAEQFSGSKKIHPQTS